VLAASGARPGDLLLVAAGPGALVCRTLDRVRQYVARQLGMVDDSQTCLLWITGGAGQGAEGSGLAVWAPDRLEPCAQPSDLSRWLCQLHKQRTLLRVVPAGAVV
jgi:hypothetical protein